MPRDDWKNISLTVRLPRDLAEEARRMDTEDPEFLSRVILYGLTRRSIYRHLREQKKTPT